MRNKNLCYSDTMDWHSLFATESQKTKILQNRDKNECGKWVLHSCSPSNLVLKFKSKLAFSWFKQGFFLHVPLATEFISDTALMKVVREEWDFFFLPTKMWTLWYPANWEPLHCYEHNEAISWRTQKLTPNTGLFWQGQSCCWTILLLTAVVPGLKSNYFFLQNMNLLYFRNFS